MCQCWVLSVNAMEWMRAYDIDTGAETTAQPEPMNKISRFGTCRTF